MQVTLNLEDLQKFTGYQRPADIERCLKRQHVPFLVGKNGPITTLDAINQAIGVKVSTKDLQKIEF